MQGLERHESPVRGPQGLAWDGSHLWVTSAGDGHIYEIDPRTLGVRNEFTPPHEALGVIYTGSDFRLVLAPTIEEPDLERDLRYVYSFAPATGFEERFPCPDFSGSFLAYGNGTLYLSQAWDKKLIELNGAGAPVRELELQRRPVGMTIVDRAFYLATVDEEWADGTFQRLGLDASASSIETLLSFPFKPRSVAYDGERFWTADRNNHAIVAIS